MTTDPKTIARLREYIPIHGYVTIKYEDAQSLLADAELVVEATDRIENAFSALGLHPDSTDDIAQLICEIRDESRAHFHALTKANERAVKLERYLAVALGALEKIERCCVHEYATIARDALAEINGTETT